METVSVPWELTAIQGSKVTFRYQQPSCLALGSPSISLRGNTKTGQGVLTVEFDMPFDRPTCPEIWREASTVTAIQGGPGAPAPPVFTHIDHGPVGPVGTFQPVPSSTTPNGSAP